MVSSATAEAILGLFPVSPITNVTSHGWTLSQSATRTGGASGPWWITAFDDDDIFAYQFVHAQLNGVSAADPARSYDLRIGKSGQIYSLATQGLETQPPQFRPSNPAADSTIGGGAEWAPWVDDVLQMVTANGNLNTRLPDPSTGDHVGPWRIHANASEHTDATSYPHQSADYKYFMHGAGAYMRDFQTDPVHNPTLASREDTTAKSYASMHWMVQAHSPSIFPGHAINYYRYRDIGGGFFEVTAIIYNFRYDAPVFEHDNSTNGFPGSLNVFNFPIGGVRETTYGKFYLTDADGDLIEQTGRQTFNERPDPTPFNNIGGWLCFSAGSEEGNRALAIVTGGHREVEGYDSEASDLRWGYIDVTAPTSTQITTKRNYQLASFIRNLRLNAGRGIWARWYIGVGVRDDLKATIDANNLATSHASFGLTDFREGTTPLLAWYGTKSGPLTDVPGTTPPLFYTYAWPVSGSIPLFQVKSSSNVYRLTTDPYHFTSTATEGNFDQRLFKSYDGSTSEWTCLGFVMPEAAATNANGTALPYARLGDIFSPSFYVIPEAPIDPHLRTDLRIVNASSGKWLFSPNNSATPPSLQPSTSTGANTRWQLFPSASDDHYYLQNLATGRRLASTSANTVAEVAGTVTTNAARWRPAALSGGNVRLVNIAEGTALAENAAATGLELVPITTTGLKPRWKFVNIL